MTDVVVSKLQLRRSITPGYRPASLSEGEVFVQLADQKWIIGGLNGAAQIDVPFASMGGGGGYTLPAASASALGGVKSASAPSNQFQTGINTTGAPTFAQPTILNVSGLQAALDAKAPLAFPTFTGTLTAAALTVSGATSLGNLNTTGNIGIGGTGTLTISNGGASISGTAVVGGLQTTGSISVSGTASLTSVTTTGNIGIGGTGTLTVSNGGATISGTATVGALSTTGNISVGGSASLTSLSTTSSATIGGTLSANSGLTVTGGLNVSGGSLIAGCYLHDGTVDFQAGANYVAGATKSASSNFVKVYAGGTSGWIQLWN